MAQVRKMNNGGSVQKLKYGSIIKNGTKYEMNEETMKRLEQHIAAADPDIQQSLADDWNLLRSGQDVTIDTFSNQRSTKPSDFSEGQMRRLGKDKPTESRWHGRFNTDVHKYNKATQYFGTFDPSKVESTAVKTKLGPGSSKFEYITNDDGTRSYRSLPNTDEMRLFDDIAAYLAGDEVYRANYDVSGWAGFSDLDAWYKGLNNPDFLKNLRVKILNGQELSTDETDYLDYIGLGFDIDSNEKVEEQKADAELKSKQDKAWAAFNANNIWDSSLRDKQIFYNADTDSYGIDSRYMPSNLPKNTQGYYFNDDFVNQYSGYGYDWLKGKVSFNNQWYNEADLYNPMSQLYQMLNNPNNDYYNKNRRGDYAGADAVLKTDWDGVYHVPVMTDATAGRLGSMYQNPNLRYIEMDYNRPGATYRGNTLDETYNIWRYQDFSDEEGMDGLGRRQERWTITDAYGNPVFLDGNVTINGIPTYNFNDFSGLYTGSSNEADQKITYTNRVSSDPNDKEYYNRYADTSLTDANGNNIIEGWIDPTTKTVHVAINKAWGGTENTVFTNMPMNVYSAIKDLNFANNLNSPNNRVLLDEFKKLIRGKKSDITANNLIALGMSSEVAPYVIHYFTNYWMGNPTPTNRPKMKNGGVLYLQPGGPVKHIGSTNYVSDKVNQLAAQMQNPTTSKVIGDGTGLTDLDRQELWALGLDLGSAIAGYAPVVGDAAGILGGQGANLLRFNVDKQRKAEGLDAKPWRNYLTSTGIDLLSLVPIVGDTLNLGNFGKKALSTFKRLYNPIISGLGALGMINAQDAINKLISGEKLTVEDAQALSSGLQALAGLSYRGARTVNDARLAAATEPKSKVIEHKFKFKNGDQEVTKTLEKGDIDAITRVKGRENIEAKLAEIYKAKGVPEEQIPDLVRNTNYEQLGLTYKNNKWYYKDTVSEQIPDKEHGTGYYILHPSKRSEALLSRTPVDISKAAKTNKGLNYAAGRWAVKTGNINKMQGIVDVDSRKIGEDIWLDKYAKYNESIQSSIQPAIVTAEAPTPKSVKPEAPTPIQPAPSSPRTSDIITEPVVQRVDSPEPEIRPVETNQHFGSDEFDQKFAQYQMFIRGNDSPSTKQFKKRFEEFAQKDDFRKLAEDNPELVRLMIDEEINNVLGKGKRTKNSEAKLRKEIEVIKQKYGLKFKKGGILKGQSGLYIKDYKIDKTPFNIIPKPAELYNLLQPSYVTADKKSMPTFIQNPSGIKNPYLEKAALNAAFKKWGIEPYSKVDVPEYVDVEEEEIVEEPLPQIKSFEAKDLFGQHPVDRKEFSMMPEAINQGFSALRLLNGFKTNADSADILKRGNREAVMSQLKSLSPLRPINTRLLAGNAEFQMANEIEQNRPPVTNDYNKYATHDLNSKMQAAQLRGQGTRLRSEQHLANLKDIAAALHEKAMRDWEITNQNRAIMGGLAASNANIDSATLNANNESWRQYLLEKQTEFDQNRSKMENAILAENRLRWQNEAEAGYQKELETKYKALYDKATDKGNYTLNQWLSLQTPYANDLAEIRKRWQQYPTDKELAFTKSQIPGKRMFKSGGSLRSTSDQIKINKHKAFDQNWVNNNKAVRRAIEKLNDRAYNILMKILSDEI